MNNSLSLDSNCQQNDSHTTPLREVVSKIMNEYFITLDGQPAKNLHEMVIKEVELGLFKAVLQHTGGNQSKAAMWLGLARGTLRKRLAEYGLE